MMAWLCSAGESFDSIALNVYDDEKYAAELMWMNPEYIGTLVFKGGERLRLPGIEVPNEGEYPSANAPWRT